MKKVVLLGIDSASWKIIDPMIEKGILPNFKRLKNEGYTSILHSTYPPISPPGWVSLFSGYEPIHHGIFDFIKRKKESYFVEPIFSTDRKKPFVWDYLSEKNKKTIAISIPFTYPPGKMNGILISGLGTPSKDSEFTYPQSIKNDILKNYPGFDIDFEENNITDTMDYENISNKVMEVSENQFLMSKQYFKNSEWDLFCIVFRATDVMQHFFIHDKKNMERCYKKIDSYLGWYMNNISLHTTLIVCSDHGGAPVHTRFNINTWLYKNGYLHMKDKKNTFKLIDLDKIDIWLLKSPLKSFVWKLKRSKLMEPLYKIAQLFSYSRLFGKYQLVHWNKTKLYSLPTSTGLLFINQIGREPQGIVDYRNRHSLIHEFKKKILQLTYKGKKVIKDVVIIDEKFPNRSNHHISVPDIVLILHEGFTIHPVFEKDTEFFIPEKVRIGDHTEEGIIGLYSLHKKNIKKRRKENKMSIYDITPTILSLLGIKTKTDFDGKSII